jgi:exopolysaccharide/PEP-CTERM locus tyrosine autokinase
VSKIEKALRELQRARNVEKEARPPQSPIGTLAGETMLPNLEATAGHSPEGDTLELEALGGSTAPARIHIDLDALRAEGFLAPDDESRFLADEYRQIKRPLVAHAFGKRATKIEDGHIILVSSALPGDGKTFTCINLALSMAREADQSILLVDADIAKAHISHLFGANERAGLMDLLEDDSELEPQDVILETDVPGLAVMPAGGMRLHSTELLASNRMERLLKALTAQNPNRIVLIDSSPLLSTSESRVLATLCGQIVLVVHAGLTPQNAVLDAIDLVDESKAVNLILNQARGASAGSYYGKYGGYGYGYGRSPETSRDEV